MNILSVTTQKPHSTGSGTYLSEVVRALDRQGHRQAVVAGIYHSDIVSFPDGVTFHPVYYTAPGESPLPGDLDFPVLGMSDRMPYPSTRYSRLTAEQFEALEKAFISAVGEAIDRLRPDIILCHHLYLLTAIRSSESTASATAPTFARCRISAPEKRDTEENLSA